jgi:hypothetical protein
MLQHLVNMILQIKGLRFLFFVLVLMVSTPLAFGQHNYLEKNSVPFRKGNLWGYADKDSKQILVQPVFDSVSFPTFSRLPILVYRNAKCGLFYAENAADSARLVIPIQQETIRKNFHGFYIAKNDKGFQVYKADGQLFFEDYFTNIFQDMYLVFKRGEGKADVLYERNKVLVDSVFSIQKIPNGLAFYDIKRSIMPLLAFEHKPRTDIPDDGKIYATADVPETHDDIYDLTFQNPQGEMYVLSKKNKKFIKIKTVVFPNTQQQISKSEDPFREESLQKEFKKITWLTDETQNKRVFKTKTKVKFKITNQYYKNLRLIQDPKRKHFGLIENVTSNQHLALVLAPKYKAIFAHQFTYDQEVMLELVLENNKKHLFYKNNIISPTPIDGFQIYFDRIIIENNGLVGIAFLDFKTRNYIFISPKFKAILNSEQNNVDFKKVILPNGVYYYISKNGLEFYEE